MAKISGRSQKDVVALPSRYLKTASYGLVISSDWLNIKHVHLLAAIKTESRASSRPLLREWRRLERKKGDYTWIARKGAPKSLVVDFGKIFHIRCKKKLCLKKSGEANYEPFRRIMEAIGGDVLMLPKYDNWIKR